MARHKKRAADLGAWLCFEGEAGQGLRPPKGRAWGRRGYPPRLIEGLIAKTGLDLQPP